MMDATCLDRGAHVTIANRVNSTMIAAGIAQTREVHGRAASSQFVLRHATPQFAPLAVEVCPTQWTA